MSIHDENLVWAGVERRLGDVERLIPDPPPWRAPAESHRAGRAVVRVGPALRAGRDADESRRRRGRLVWGLVAVGALLLALAGTIVSGALRFEPRPDLSRGPLGPLGVLRGSDSAGNAAALPDGRVLIMTGTWVGPGGQAASVPQLWDPATGELSRLAPTADSRVNPTATLLLDGRVLVTGGYGGPYAYPSSAIATAEVWDPRTGAFTASGSMMHARVGHTATLLLDGRVLIVGGSGPATDGAPAEVWDPATDEFMPAGFLRLGRAGHQATLAGDGRVLVWGGVGGDPVGGGVAEVWDPATMDFQELGRLIDGPWDVTLTRLLDGRILATGYTVIGDRQLFAWTWDPSSDEFGSRSTAPTVLYNASAVLAQDGRVLIFGARSTAMDPAYAVEIWDPATESFSEAMPYARSLAERSVLLLPDGRILVVGPPEPGGSSSVIDVYDIGEAP